MDFSFIFPTGAFAGFLIKAFAVLFSLIFLIYAIVILRQTRVMARSINEEGGIEGIIILVSRVQVLVSIALFVLAFLL